MDPITDNIWVFLGATIVISLSGVMMPGPVFAATIAKGYKDERAGIKIAIGHALVEFPLMALVVLSVGYVFENDAVKLGIGVVGGTLLAVMGAMMIRSRNDIALEGKEETTRSTVVAGVLTTSANPYFFLWWATVGAVLIFSAQEFGALVVLVFAVVHWSCDLAWYSFTGFAVFRTKHMWTPLVHQVVFVSCGIFMMAFGAYFVYGPAHEMLS